MQYVHWTQPFTSFRASQSSAPVIVQKKGNPPTAASPVFTASSTPVTVPLSTGKTSLQSLLSPASVHVVPAPLWASKESLEHYEFVDFHAAGSPATMATPIPSACTLAPLTPQ
jgi:hypothetical protein